MGIKITNTGGNGSFKVKNLGSGGYFKATGNTGTDVVSDWVRPSDWLEMPTIGTQEFIGLLAITDDESNHIALLFRGAYTVDWGDGVTENFADNVKANHSYTYPAISDSTISSRGYKQVLVRVTPQAGQNLTTVSIQQQNSILAKVHTVGWLDIAVKGSSITSLSLGGGTVYMGMCENVDIYSWGNITSVSGLFQYFYSLQKLTLPSTAAVTSFNNMFMYCYALKTIPLIDTGLGTSFIQMLNGCTSLKTIPLFNLASATNLVQFVQGCTSLKTLPLLNTTSVTVFQEMLGNCYSLQTIPLLNTAKGVDFSYMFSGCNALQTMPLLDTSKGTNFTRMISFCNSLQQVPNLNTASGSSFSNIFASTSALAKGALQGTKYSISYANMCLSRNAVVDIFNGLGTAVGAQTITITTNPAFAARPLNVAPGTVWRGVTIQSSSQDVYASNQSRGLVYKQTGGVGPFVAESLASSPFYRGVGTDIYGNIYLANSTTNFLKKTGGVGSWTTVTATGIGGASGVISGDYLGNLYVGTTGGGAGLYKQTALTGSFVQVFTGVVASLAISPFDGSIYVTNGDATGTIYKQTAGTGTFDAVQNIPYVGSLCCMPNGDVYASNGTLFKQTGGTGSFVSMGILVGTSGMINKPDGTFYALGSDVTSLDFNQVVTPTDRLIATNKGWTIA